MKRVVIITGISSGVGLSLGKFLVDKNYIIYGISRSVINEAGINHIKADVTNEEQLITAYQMIYEKEGQIDFLINNAGMGISGSIEATKLSDAKNIFDVNFMGLFLSTKAVLPYMRKQASGRIINIGSVAGPLSIPFQAFYSSSKAAVNTFSDALANEVSPYGIGVCTILPGDIKTNFTKNRKKNIDELDVYEKRVEKSIEVMEKDEQAGMDVLYASKNIYKVMRKKNLPLRMTIGKKYKVFIFLQRLLPVKLVNKIVGSIYSFKKT
ncbi:MAG TPA: SDR family NAD(P)-dependent oxidoreductase [Acholeplasmataceae bacterium]|nr:SDR family NAD(P)-dependent oxidoreductase [Acholeplasmataceae bacterium]